MDDILETCKFVVDNSKDVKIENERIKEFSNSFCQSQIKHWFNGAPFDIKKLNDREKLHFLLIIDSINFCYWGNPKWKIEYKSKEFDGAYGLIAAFGKAYEEGINILDAKFLSEMSEEDLSQILKGNTKIPLFEERLKILREVGSVLLEKFDCDFINIVQNAKQDAQELLRLVIENFPLFNDSSLYKGKIIYFYKRAQLLVLDIFQAFDGKGLGELRNIDKMTACSDYKLPQILRKLKILSYSGSLSNKIDNQIQISKESKEEIEIRANTIWVIELIKEEIKKRIESINSSDINYNLWMQGQEKKKDDKPYHLTRTTFY